TTADWMRSLVKSNSSRPRYPFPALVGHLVVPDDLVDAVAEAVGLAQVRGAVVVAVDRQEDLIVVLDQPGPQPQAGGAFDGGDGVAGDGEDVVRGDDRRERRMVGQHLVRPREYGVGRIPRQREDEERAPLGRERVPLVHAGRV